jgi:hypothetical protein
MLERVVSMLTKLVARFESDGRLGHAAGINSTENSSSSVVLNCVFDGEDEGRRR